jgi:uncharacterized protein YbjQ (UPF0145 family)
MTDRQPSAGAEDLRAQVRRAVASLEKPPRHAERPATTDLSLDEELCLHAVGWEPVDLVVGISLFSVPSGVWSWGQGEITWASNAFMQSFAAASNRIHHDCRRAGGHGVVGVRVEQSVHRHHVEVTLVGTAVRPVGAKGGPPTAVFLSDLSGRDFALLEGTGWEPLGLAAGASFVYAPRRSVGTVMRQTSQNVELTNFTEAIYSARETAMERMQRSALELGGTGVVEVKITEGPVSFAGHAVGFAAYGTVVRHRGGEQRLLRPQVVLPLDDAVQGFEATSLRGE